MCGGSPKAPPPPPPPAPDAAAPVMIGAKDASNLTGNTAQKVGKKKLQIPLTQAGGSTGLGIPSQ